MDAGGEERFIDIDVAQARDHSLIEQCVFDGSGRFRQSRADSFADRIVSGSGPMSAESASA